MNKDELKGKAKDVAGRVQRQAGEWTDNEEQQAKGLGKQAEGKIQQGVGKAEDAAKKAMQDMQRKNNSQQGGQEKIKDDKAA